MENNFGFMKGQLNGGLSKAEEKALNLNQTTANKEQELAGNSVEASIAKLRAAQYEQYKLDNIGFGDRATNMALGFADATTNLAGTLATALPATYNEGTAASYGFTADEFKMLEGIQGKQAKIAEYTKLALDPNSSEEQRNFARKQISENASTNYSDEEAAFMKRNDYNGMSRYDQLANYEEQRGFIKDISGAFENNWFAGKVDRSETEDVTGNITNIASNAMDVANKGLDKVFNGNMAEGLSDITDGVLGLTLDAGAAVLERPGVIPQLLAESAPSSVASVVSLPLTLTSMITSKQQKAIEGYITEHGEMPTGEAKTKLNLSSAASGVLDLMGDRILAGAIKPTKGIAGKVRNVGATGAGEFVAEAGAAITEDYAVKQDVDKLDVAGAYAQGVLGAAAGGTLSGTTETAGAIANVGEAKAKKVAEEAKQAAPLTKDIEKEVADTTETNEVPEVVKPYVEKAKIAQKALQEAQDPEAGPVVQKAAFTAIMDMIGTVNTLQGSMNENSTDADIQAIAQITGDKDKFFNQAKEALTINKNGEALLNKLHQGTATEADMTSLKPVAMQVLYSASLTSTGLNEDGSVDSKFTTRLEDVRNNPELTELMTPEELDLVDQKIATLKNMEEVAQDIKKGSGGDNFFRGAEQFYAEARKLVDNGDMEGAQAEIDKFNTFAQGHIAKAEAASKLLAERKALGLKKGDPGYEGVPLVSTVNGKKVEHRNLADNGKGMITPSGNPIMIHAGSGPNLVKPLLAEAKYLKEASKFINGLTNPSIMEKQDAVSADNISDVTDTNNNEVETTTPVTDTPTNRVPFDRTPTNELHREMDDIALSDNTTPEQDARYALLKAEVDKRASEGKPLSYDPRPELDVPDIGTPSPVTNRERELVTEFDKSSETTIDTDTLDTIKEISRLKRGAAAIQATVDRTGSATHKQTAGIGKYNAAIDKLTASLEKKGVDVSSELAKQKRVEDGEAVDAIVAEAYDPTNKNTSLIGFYDAEGVSLLHVKRTPKATEQEKKDAPYIQVSKKGKGILLIDRANSKVIKQNKKLHIDNVGEVILSSKPSEDTLQPKDISHKNIQDLVIALGGKVGVIATPLRDLVDEINLREYVESVGDRRVSLSRIIREETSNASPEVRAAFYKAMGQVIAQTKAKEVPSPPNTFKGVDATTSTGSYTQTQTVTDQVVDTTPNGTQGELFGDAPIAPIINDDTVVEAVTETNPNQGELDLTVDEGILYGLNNEVMPDSMFKEGQNITDEHRINAVVKFFKNKTNSAIGQVGNITTMLANSTLDEAKTLLGRFTNTDRMNQADMDTLKNFEDFKVGFGTRLKANVEASAGRLLAEGKTTAERRKNSPLLYLLDANGKLPQKVVDGLAMAAFNWVAYQSRDAAFNTGKDIHRILGGDGKQEVYAPILADAGTVKTEVVDYIGSMAMDMIGLSADRNTPQAMYDAIKGDLANAAIFVMSTANKGTGTDAKHMGIMTATPVNGKLFQSLQADAGITESAQSDANRSFLKLNADLFANQEAPSAIHTKIKAIRDKAFDESSRITEKLGNPDQNTDSLYIGKAPKNVTEVRIKGTDRTASPKAVDGHNKATHRKYYPNMNMVNMLFGENGLGVDFIRDMLGYEKTDIGYGVADLGRKGLNNTIDNAIRNAEGFIKEYSNHEAGSPVYFDGEFVSQMRHQMKGAFNPQREKLHRFMMGFKPETLKFTKKDMLGFNLAVAQGLGIKVDKNNHIEAQRQLKDLLATDDFKAAIYELRQGLNGNQMDSTNILPAVLQGEEKAGSLKALMSYAEMLEAKESGAKTFETDIMFEIDGVTNGPFHAQLQLGLTTLSKAVQQSLSRSGLYKSSRKVNHNKNAATSDNYISTANVASAFLDQTVGTLTQGMRGAFETFKSYSGGQIAFDEETGEYVIKRNLAKGPTTYTTYGASAKSTNVKLMHQALDGLNEVLDKAVQEAELNVEGSTDVLAEAINHISKWNDLLSTPIEIEGRKPKFYDGKVQHVNDLLGIGPKSTNMDVLTAIKNFEFKANQKNHMSSLYGATMGKALEEGIAATLGEVQNNSKDIILMTGIMHKLHEAQVAKDIDELIANSTSIFGPTRGEIAEVIKKNQSIAPSFKTYLGEQGKTENYLQLSDRKVRQGDVVGTPLLGSGSRELYGSLPTFDAPGVKGLPLSTIQLDAMNSMVLNLTDNINHLNVFDGFYVSPSNIGPMTKSLNTSDLTVNRDFNLYSEFANQLENTFNNHPLLGDPTVLPEVKQQFLLDTLRGNPNVKFNPFEHRELAQMVELGMLSGEYKNDFLDNVILTDSMQPNSTYLVHSMVQFFRAKGNMLADNKAEAMKGISYNQFVGMDNTQVTTDSTGAVNDINKAAKDFTDNHVLTPRIEAEVSKTLIENGVNVATHAEGTVIKGKKEISELLDSAVGSLGTGDKAVTGTRKVLVNMLKKLVTDDTEVRYMDFNGATLGNQKLDPTAKGAYVDGVVAVNTNRSVATSDMSVAETIIHELVHATVTQTVHDIKTGVVKGTRVQTQAIYELENMLKWMVKNYIENNALVNTMPPALTHVAHMYATAKTPATQAAAINELIAYGLTDEATARTLSHQTPKTTLNILKRVMEAIKKLLGIKIPASALTDVLASYFILATSVKDTNPNKSVDVMYNTSKFDTNQIFADLKDETNTARQEVLIQALNELERDVTGTLATTFSTEQRNIEISAEKVLLDQLSPDIVTTTNSLVNAGFNMSEKESLVYQMYAEVLNTAMNENYHSKNEIRKIFQQAKKDIDYTAFLNDGKNADDVLMAKQKYNAIFANESSDVNVLGNFMAMAKTNVELRDALYEMNIKNVSRKDVANGWNSVNQIERLIKKTYNKVADKVTGVGTSKNSLDRLEALAKRITHIKAKKATLVDSGLEKAGKVVAFSDNLIKTGASSLAKRTQRHFSKTRGSVAVVHALEAVAKDEPNVIQAAFKDVVNLGGDKKLGFLQEFAQEMIGVSKESEPLHALKRTSQYQTETKREAQKRAVRDNINEVLDISDVESKAVTELLRTDVTSLVANGFSLDRVVELMNDPVKLQDEIDTQTAVIRGQNVPNSTKNFYINSAVGLGKYMATGLVYNEFQLPNAKAIANGSGTNFNTANNNAEKAIDNLATLIAMQETDMGITVDLMSREAKGMKHVLAKHHQVKREALAQYGEAGKYTTIKGYLYDITNPNKSVTFGTHVEKKLTDRGYSRVSPLRADRNDVSPARQYMYVSEDAGNVSFVSGALSTITTLVSGIDHVTGRVGSMKLPSYGRGNETQAIHLKKKKAIADMGKLQTLSSPVNAMLPTVSTTGDISGFRYEMSHAEKDSMLERDNNVANVLGAWSGRIAEENSAVNYNKELVSVLFDRYDNANTVQRRKFLSVSPNSPDKKMRDLYYLMPKAMRDEAKEQFGGTTLYVHKEDLNNAMGYRELSILQLWDKQDQSKMAKVAVKMFESILGKNAAGKLRKGERGIQELVSTIKDWIIIKSIVVSAANIVSNIAQMKLRGVSFKDMTNDSVTAYEAVTAYRTAQSEKMRIEDLIPLTHDTTKQTALRVRLNELNQELANNPVKGMVEQGMLPTVADDLTQADMYSLKHSAISKFTNAAPFTKQNPDSLITNLMINQGTKSHDFLTATVEMGDFVSKYTMYKHFQKQGMTPDQAMKKVAVEFIDYSALSHPLMDYANKTGMAHFFKYFLRRTPILASILADSPTRVLALMLGQDVSGVDIASPYDSLLPDMGAKTGLIDLMGGVTSHPLSPI